MYYRGDYMDVGDGREMGLKRQRVIGQGSSYYGAPPASNYMYSPPPPPAYSYINQPSPFPVVRLRGLPFDCSEADIAEFFHGLDIVDILFIHKNGRFAGEAYCVLGYAIQVDLALQKNMQNIGRRYVEVFRSKRQEYYKAIAGEVSDRGGSPHRSAPRSKLADEGKDLMEHTGVLRLRGLPFSARKDDVIDFFKDFELSEDSIHFTVNSEGRLSGEAFVKFANAEDSKAAMVKDMKSLGSRYIELFPSSFAEWEDAASRSSAYGLKSSEDRMDEETNVLRMRGLPFSAGKSEIMDFFSEFELTEDSIHMAAGLRKPTGEAFVEFASVDDARAAMANDRMTLGSRYIELFPSSLEDMRKSTSRRR